MDANQNKNYDEEQTKKTREKYKHTIFITCVFTFVLLTLFATVAGWLFIKEKKEDKKDPASIETVIDSLMKYKEEMEKEDGEEQEGKTEDENGAEEAGEESGRPEAREIDIINGSYLDKVSRMADLAGEYADDEDNFAFSPASFDMAMMLVYPGADDKTKDLLGTYLGVKESGAEKFSRMVKNYNQKATEKDSTKLTFANSVWYRDDNSVTEKYRQGIADFRAELYSFPSGGGKDTIDKINRWASEKTEGNIEKIMDPNQNMKDVNAVLVNALYFYSEWENSWSDPCPSVFHGKKDREVDFISRRSENFYYENDNALAFSVKYRNGFDFYGILPKWEGDFTLTDLDIGSLVKNRISIDRVYSRMPVFKFESSMDMVKAVADTELKDILKTDAFPYITESAKENRKMVKVDKIIQQSTIDINKDGTEASAVTTIVTINDAAAPVPIEMESIEINLTRPFAFMIYDEKNDTVLFIGKVTDVGK